MRAFRILLAGLSLASGSAAVSAQTPLFSTKPTTPAPTATSGQLPPMAAMLPQGGQTPQPTEILTAPATGLPCPPIPGAAYSPWTGDQPIGGNGPITYEGYFRTGPSFLADAAGFNGTLKTTGWVFQTGARTLLFNVAGDAAWALDLGLGTSFFRGNTLEHPIGVLASELKGGDPSNTVPIPLGVRSLSMTSFNFGLGRDWFFNGPGIVGRSPETNWKFGIDVGGHWGTASVGFEPQFDPGGYRRRHGIYHGIYVGTGLNWERDMGGWILQAGIRAEYSYDWTNLIPPLSGDIQSVNVMMTLGFRF